MLTPIISCQKPIAYNLFFEVVGYQNETLQLSNQIGFFKGLATSPPASRNLRTIQFSLMSGFLKHLLSQGHNPQTITFNTFKNSDLQLIFIYFKKGILLLNDFHSQIK